MPSLHSITNEPCHHVQHLRIRMQHLTMVLCYKVFGYGNDKRSQVDSVQRSEYQACVNQSVTIRLILLWYCLSLILGIRGTGGCAKSRSLFRRNRKVSDVGLRLWPPSNKTGDTSCSVKWQSDLPMANLLGGTPKRGCSHWKTIGGLSWRICSEDPPGHSEPLANETPWEWMNSWMYQFHNLTASQ